MVFDYNKEHESGHLRLSPPRQWGERGRMHELGEVAAKNGHTRETKRRCAQHLQAAELLIHELIAP